MFKWIVSPFLLLLFGCQSSPESSEHDESDELNFVQIEKGYYMVGKSQHPINPNREVDIETFEISTTEVTNKMWTRFIEETGYLTTAEKLKNAMVFYPGLDEFEWVGDSTANWRYPFGKDHEGIDGKEDYPVSCISHIDALAFCEWGEYRLPTLDEWEVACRAGTNGAYHFEGGYDSLVLYANIWQSKTHKSVDVQEDYLYHSPVATYKPNPWGLYDMYGNCFEFCADKPEKWADNESMVCARGGSWWCSKNSCNYFNSYDIGRVHKAASFSNHGFRVVKL